MTYRGNTHVFDSVPPHKVIDHGAARLFSRCMADEFFFFFFFSDNKGSSLTMCMVNLFHGIVNILD